MLAAQRKSASSFSTIAKQPAAIAAFAVAAIAIAFGASRMMRRAPTPAEVSSTNLASESSPHSRKENLKAQASPEVRQAIEQSAHRPQAPEGAKTIAVDGGSALAPSMPPSMADAALASQVHFHPPGETATTTAKSAATSGASGKGSKAREESEVQVAFAWTEVSHQWLLAMGAADPGLHRVPDLEGRLSDSKGAYRILEVSKQKITGEMTSFGVRRGDREGDRTGLRVEISSVTENGLTGSIQMSYRGSDGGMRAPAAAALAIEKGQGSILTFAPVQSPPGVAPTGVEIVVLILPRWGADRNP